MFRGRLGTARTARHLVDGVHVDAIPILSPGYKIFSSDERSIIGDAPKNFIAYPTPVPHAHAYIAKAPRREGPRECVTEYLIYRVGAELPVKLAKGRLARLPVRPGAPPDVRFLSRFFLGPQEQLLHGVELAAQCYEVSPQALADQVGRDREWAFYTVDIIDEMLARAASRDETYRGLRSAFARMMTFDALVGANDRHPQNWGLIQSATDPNQPVRFAPIFDTARGLFWNSAEEKLRENDRPKHREQFIEHYANRSYPLIGTASAKRPNHFDVIAYMVGVDGGARYLRDIAAVVGAFSLRRTEEILHRHFRRIFSRLRLRYILDLLAHRHGRLRFIVAAAGHQDA